MAPRQWHQHPVKNVPSSFVLALESTTRPKTKTEAQIFARWRNRTSVYTWHPLKRSRSLIPHPAGRRDLPWGGVSLQKWTKNVAGKATGGNSYRGVIGFCRKRLLWRPGCTECASWLLSRCARRFPGRE